MGIEELGEDQGDPHGTAPGPTPDPLPTAPMAPGLLQSRPSILSSGRQACLVGESSAPGHFERGPLLLPLQWYVYSGARTFLSAASPECRHGSDLLPLSAKHVAADRNVRAPGGSVRIRPTISLPG